MSNDSAKQQAQNSANPLLGQHYLEFPDRLEELDAPPFRDDLIHSRPEIDEGKDKDVPIKKEDAAEDIKDLNIKGEGNSTKMIKAERIPYSKS